jgi:hypothetical protein
LDPTGIIAGEIKVATLVREVELVNVLIIEFTGPVKLIEMGVFAGVIGRTNENTLLAQQETILRG